MMKATCQKLLKLMVLSALAMAALISLGASAQSAPVTSPPSPTSQRAIPDDNLAYPVFIATGNSSGSGFFLNTGKEIFLVTAKHVFFNQQTQQPFATGATLISYSKDVSDLTRNVLTLDLTVLQSNKDFRAHASQDLVAVRIFEVGQPSSTNPGLNSLTPVRGVTLVSYAKNGFLSVDIKGVRKFDQVLTGNDVMVFGYPTSLGLQQSPQLDPLRPLLRKGIVAGTNPATRFIVLDCPVYFGNSGGPVLEIDRLGFGSSLSIIGVVDQYVPFVQQAGSQTMAVQLDSNSGYSIAIPMDYVLELIP